MEEQEFERLLKISRLKLTERERKRIKADIDDVLAYFDKISRVDVNGDPAYQPTHVPTRFRKDVVLRFDETGLLKEGAELHDDYIVGPKL